MSVAYLGMMSELTRFAFEQASLLEEQQRLIEKLELIRDGFIGGEDSRTKAISDLRELLPALEKVNANPVLLGVLTKRLANVPDHTIAQPAAQPIAIIAPGYIYFIAAPEASRIKIGFSTNPDKRIASLMTSSAYKLETLAVVEGNREQEQALHARFSHLRTHRDGSMIAQRFVIASLN